MWFDANETTIHHNKKNPYRMEGHEMENMKQFN